MRDLHAELEGYKELYFAARAELAAARARIAELEGALTWRPIAEAPKDGRWVAASNVNRGPYWYKAYWSREAGLGWLDQDGEMVEPTHFYDVPAPEPPKEAQP